eukprot:14287568-Alexandrium_andersonii.AAC.1
MGGCCIGALERYVFLLWVMLRSRCDVPALMNTSNTQTTLPGTAEACTCWRPVSTGFRYMVAVAQLTTAVFSVASM